MGIRFKKFGFTTTVAVVLLISFFITSIPVYGASMQGGETTVESVTQTEEKTEPISDSLEIAGQESVAATNEEPNLLQTQEPTANLADVSPLGQTVIDGVTYAVSIAKSTDGGRPADTAFVDSDSIDLASVGRYDMFYAYLKIDYENHSGADLSNPSITMQMPKIGDAGYYEVYSQSGAPANWVAYPNTPTGDGNANFPAGNMNTNATSRLMTWTGSGIINDGSSGTIYIKIPMRDPFTKFGTINFNPVFHFIKSGLNLTVDESATFIVSGQDDTPSFSLTKVDDLGFVPTEPDADQYFYVKYHMTNNGFSYYYALPKRAYEFDRFLLNAYIDITFPPTAEFVSKNFRNSSVNASILRADAHYGTGDFVLRYPKSLHSNPLELIDVSGVYYGRYSGNIAASNVLGTESTFSHQIGTGSTIPDPILGNITTVRPALPISEDSLKVGSVAFTRSASTLTRSLDTIRGDQLTFEFNGVEYLKNNISLPTDYGITIIYLASATWSGNLDPLHPMSGSITVFFDDGSSEVLINLNESNFVAANGGALYNGNAPQMAGGYIPPAGKTAKRVVFNFYNVPQGFQINPYVNGYVTGYPEGGADYLRILRTTNLYGTDTGSGRPTAVGSGDTSNNVAIAKNTKFEPTFTIERNSSGTVNPGQTDTIKLQSFFGDKAKQSFVNPEFDVLLPVGYTFDSYTDFTVEFLYASMTIFNLPDGVLTQVSPVIEIIPNYNGTGRMLVRIKYSGILQESETLAGLLTIRAAQYMSPGNYQIDGYFAAENIGTTNNLSSLYTPYSLDVNDMNGNGMVDDYIFGAVSSNLTISRGTGTTLYSQMKGSFDPALTGLGTTKQNTIIDGALTLEYNGATAMNNIRLISVLPYEGDGKTFYGGIDDGQRVLLSSPVDVSAYPGSTVYYNTTPTNDPNATGWTTTYSTDARAVRIDLSPTFELLSGAIEKISIPLNLQVPGTTNPADLPMVQGRGYLPVKVYSNINGLGLEGAGSIVESLTLGLNVNVFKDTNANGIKDSNERWLNNVRVEVFNLTDDIATATPLYSGMTNVNGNISFLDGISGVIFALQGYRVVVHMPGGDYNYVSGVGDITTDGSGQQGVVFNTSNQLVNVLTAFAPQMMSISGSYWQDYETAPNGIFDAHDLLTPAGRVVRLFNVTGNTYETSTAMVQADGSYLFPAVAIGPEYRVEFPYNSANEEPSVLAENMVTITALNTLGYPFDSSGQVEGSDFVVNAAIIENGTINVRFSTDGINTIGTTVSLRRWLPTIYTAQIGTSGNTTEQTLGTFVVPYGYRLLASEPTEKTATIDSTTKTRDIIFLVELLEPDLSGVKTSNPSTDDLHPGDTITYTITVTNSGTAQASDIVVTDQVPAFTYFVSADQGGTVDGNGQIRWSIATLAENGGSYAVSFTVRILPRADLGEWAVVNDQAKINNVPTNSTTNLVTQSVLTSKKVSDVKAGQSIYRGQTITYTITTTNTGVIPSEKVIITDTIPEGTTFVADSLSSGANMVDTTISIAIESLKPGETLTLSFKVTVNKDVKKGTVIKNIGSVNETDTNPVHIQIAENVEEPIILPKTAEMDSFSGLLELALLSGAFTVSLLFHKRRKTRVR